MGKLSVHDRLHLEKRENIGAKLLNNSVNNIFHQQFRNDKNVEVFNKGNFTDLISREI